MSESIIHMVGDSAWALSLNDTLFVTDNLAGVAAAEQDEGLQRDVQRFPMKLTTACMVIVLKGSVKFSVNFRDCIATESDCILITEGTIVENVVFEEGARAICLTFAQQALSGPSSLSQGNLHRLYAMQVVLVKLLPQHLEMMKTVYQMLRTVMSDPSFALNREATAFSCLDLMLNIVMQASGSQPELTTKASRRDEIVARFLQCVADNYRSHRELSFYADQLDLSLKYMSHVVYEQTGRHPSQWIKDYVILDAKTMLRSGRYTVQQVADELNFPNQSFFGKYFKEAVGISPKKWK